MEYHTQARKEKNESNTITRMRVDDFKKWHLKLESPTLPLHTSATEKKKAHSILRLDFKVTQRLAHVTILDQRSSVMGHNFENILIRS